MSADLQSTTVARETPHEVTSGLMRRWLLAGLDWLVVTAQVLSWQLAGFGVLTRLLGRPPGWPGTVLWTAGQPAHTAALLAAGLLARTLTGAAGVLADPAPVDWPHRIWPRLAAVVQDAGLVLLLAAAVMVLGGGWPG